LKVGKVEVTTLDKLEDSAWGAYNDVRLLDTLEQSNMLIKRHTTEDHLCADVWHLALESLELLLDLIGELSVMAKDKSGAWLGVFWELMKDS
jgi:hypothetical protein